MNQLKFHDTVILIVFIQCVLTSFCNHRAMELQQMLDIRIPNHSMIWQNFCGTVPKTTGLYSTLQGCFSIGMWIPLRRPRVLLTSSRIPLFLVREPVG